MKTIFERIRGHDKQDVFKYPVSRAEVPGYYDVIEKPMWWGVIEGRLDGHEYWDVKDFQVRLLSHPLISFYLMIMFTLILNIACVYRTTSA